jgi:hypothetical protein
MFHVLEWFLFGMFVWGCVICMSAIAHRLAPNSGPDDRKRHRHRRHFWRNQEEPTDTVVEDDPKDLEIRDLRKRIETLEAIVTDRRYQWDDAFSKD